MWFSLVFCIIWVLFIFLSIVATKWVLAGMSVLIGDKKGLQYHGNLCDKNISLDVRRNHKYPVWNEETMKKLRKIT